jgi:gentisate 1,2-dioxygenase
VAVAHEHSVDPDYVDSRLLLWPWRGVAPHLGVMAETLAPGYNGHLLLCLYNPATGTRNGTTALSSGAIIASVPCRAVGPVHRHSSAAINYIVSGSGWSLVEGSTSNGCR